MKRKFSAALLALSASLLLVACDREPDYTVTKQTKESPAIAHGAGFAEAHAHVHALQYDIPDGWQLDPTPRPMREATIIVGQADRAAEVIVTRLASNFGNLGDNINRWRGQIGLPPLEDPASVEPKLVDTPVGKAKVYRFEGDDKASIIALVELGEQTWFFRFTGEKATVLENEAKLEQLLTSLKQQQD